MKKTLLTAALLVAGLVTFGTASTAHAQDVGISVHGQRGGFSFHLGNGYHHRGSHYHHPHHPGRYHHPPVYHSPIRVVVYETILVREWNPYTHRWVLRKQVVERWVTAYWNDYYGCHGYYDSFGSFRRVR